MNKRELTDLATNTVAPFTPGTKAKVPGITEESAVAEDKTYEPVFQEDDIVMDNDRIIQ